MAFYVERRGLGSPRRCLLCAVEGLDGAGKTTLIAAAGARLGARRQVLATSLARETVDLFKEAADVPSGRRGEYQQVFPASFRHAVYVVEAAVQMRLMRRRYDEFDVVLFDRWVETNEAYLEPIDRHEAHYELLRRSLPRPDRLYYLRVPPAVAAERLAAKGDWMTLRFSQAELGARLAHVAAVFDRVCVGPGVVTLDGTRPPLELEEIVVADLESALAERNYR